MFKRFRIGGIYISYFDSYLTCCFRISYSKSFSSEDFGGSWRASSITRSQTTPVTRFSKAKLPFSGGGVFFLVGGFSHQELNGTESQRTQFSKLRDRAIRYSGFFGVREKWVLFGISWIFCVLFFFFGRRNKKTWKKMFRFPTARFLLWGWSKPSLHNPTGPPTPKNNKRIQKSNQDIGFIPLNETPMRFLDVPHFETWGMILEGSLIVKMRCDPCRLTAAMGNPIYEHHKKSRWWPLFQWKLQFAGRIHQPTIFVLHS